MSMPEPTEDGTPPDPAHPVGIAVIRLAATLRDNDVLQEEEVQEALEPLIMYAEEFDEF